MPKQQGIKQAAANRKAFHDYFVLDRYEAGIELSGTEVKSIRAGTLNLKDSYCIVKSTERSEVYRFAIDGNLCHVRPVPCRPHADMTRLASGFMGTVIIYSYERRQICS